MSAALEQQIDGIMSASGINTLHIGATREDDGSVRFYAVVHAGGLCVYSELLNLPTVREAIASGIQKLNERRLAAPDVAELTPMEQAA